MITLRQLAQEVIRLESGGDKNNDSQLSEGYIILLCRQASNKFVAPMILSKMAQDDRGVPTQLIVRYQVNVQGDSPNKYFDIPECYIDTPFNKGIRVALVEDPTNEGIPRHNPGVSRSLPCADLDKGQFSFYLEGQKGYLDDNFDYGKVLLKILVASPDSIGIDAALPIYPENQFDLIAMVRQMLQGQPIQDKILDNNKDVGVRTQG